MKRNTSTGSRLARADHRSAYLFVTPFLASFLLFFAIPAIYSLALSFFRYKGYGAATFVGVQNYGALLQYSAFWKSIRNTLYYFILHIIPVMAGSFLFAQMLFSMQNRLMQKIFKPLLFLPQVVPVMATALTFKIIFSTNTGVINQIFHLSVGWLEQPALMRLCVVALVVWRSTGWFMVIFLAGLASINHDLYEAAMLDGANGPQKTFYITLPMMRPIFLFAFIMDAISSFKIYTEVNVMIAGTGNAPTDAASVMNMITQNLSSGNFGMASAAGWLLFLLIMGISLLERKLLSEKE